MYRIFDPIMRNKSNNKNKNKPAGKARKRRANRAILMGSSLPSAAMAYRDLLLDPCSAKLTGPVGVAAGTGLFVRYRRYHTPSLGLPAGQKITNAVIDFNPRQQNATIYVSEGGNIPFTLSTTINFSSGVLGSGTARAYRIIAACVKWTPTGALLNRSGVVRSFTAPDPPGFGGNTPDGCKGLAQHTAFNGSETHEAVYLPTGPHDLDFINTTDSDAGVGSSFGLMLEGIDATVAPAGGGPSEMNGFFEIVYVAEWMPALGNTMSNAMHSAPATTLSQVYQTIQPYAMAAVSHVVRMALQRGFVQQMANVAVQRIVG